MTPLLAKIGKTLVFSHTEFGEGEARMAQQGDGNITEAGGGSGWDRAF